MSINKVALSGNITRDPELKTTQTGVDILSIGLAVNESRKGKSGQWENYANYIDCKVIGPRANGLSGCLKKGMKVAITGKLHYSSWENHEGKKRSKIEVVVDELDFMSPKETQAKQDDPLYDVDIPF